MKINLKGYTEPLSIEVERPDGTTATIEAVLDFSDVNLIAAKGDAKAVVAAADGQDGSDERAALSELAEMVSAAIDRLAGEGTASAIIEAFGFDDAGACASSLVDVWKSINEEAAARAGEKRVRSASRYLDANA